jgi:purine-binding chemotaxis protein CheW
MTAAASRELQPYDQLKKENAKEFLTFMIGDQRFGLPILQVQDVLGKQRVTKIPLAPPEVAGSLNLRGRIVTAIDVRRRLGMPAGVEADIKDMSIVVEHDAELYSLIIDKVSDVMSLESNAFEKSLSTLDPILQDVSSGIYRLKGELLVILDVAKFIGAVRA